jgi:hypothetical protein
MRRCLLVVLALVLFGGTAAAQVGVFRSAGIAPAKESASVEEMIARVMSFDHDRDGAVGADELLDRMQGLLERGDRDDDGRLDRAEVRALASAPPRSTVSVGFPFSSSYTFGDQIGLSSRAHVEGALEDLRLDDAAHGRALGIVATFMDALEAHAAARLLDEMAPLLTAAQLSDVRDAVESRGDRQPLPRWVPDVDARRVVVFSRGLEQRIAQYRLPLEEREAALAAVARYRDTIRPGDAERPVLVAALGDVLDDGQRENLEAALARRPVVSTSGMAMVNADLPREAFERLQMFERTIRRVQTGPDGRLVEVE